MNADKSRILNYMAACSDVVLAKNIMLVCKLSHEECYQALVELENAGLARVFAAAHWKPGVKGRHGWELTDAGLLAAKVAA